MCSNLGANVFVQKKTPLCKVFVSKKSNRKSETLSSFVKLAVKHRGDREPTNLISQPGILHVSEPRLDRLAYV